MIINGKEIADDFCKIISCKVDVLKSSGIFPHIALVNASADSASEIYISRKRKLAESLGIKSTIHQLSGNNVREEDVAELLNNLNLDDSVTAILLQSPLAYGLNFRKLVDIIDPHKDADALTSTNQGKLFTGEPCIAPCTPLGVLHLIHSVRENISGSHAVVLGRSSIVGKPMAQLLLNKNCSVTTLHSHSRNIQDICATADIIVSAIGKPRYVQKHFVKPGAIVIDVGINRIEIDGARKIVGDVDFHPVSEVAAAISPVPNGVGPMTVAYLMYNTMLLARGNEDCQIGFM
ncbi:MAG: bifunctional methylenetetrahydrofolate dehydrogenase/methenyltetrahydrofolate cyclohydrolase [Holosporaceae bacterium]|nr:bifunctional methylenetetrahydrofolate dehydrogenase/methenyltetrahydrofolate cyclohydrolase [Holosporaceae bacterium]